MYGRPASLTSSTAIVVRGICISESAPSCMRAPPEAVITMNAASCSTARRAAASSPSPSAQPIEPAMNSKFITAITAGRPSIRPCAASIASGSPVALWASFSRSV